MNFEIRAISVAQVLPVRHQVMWPNKPLAFVKLPNDQHGRHLGLNVNKQLVSVISLFIKNNQVQFRKFATLVEFQGMGYGSTLFKRVNEIVVKENYEKLWCNAQVNKTSFYKKFGMQQIKSTFVKEGVKYVIMEKKFKNN